MKLQILLAFWAIKVTLATKDPEKAITCEPMKVDLCMSAQDNFYNTTGFPNFKGDRVQTDAGEQLKTWVPLLETQCAAELLLFLCTIHVPMCSNIQTETSQKLIGPCKPLCEKVHMIHNIK